MADESADFVQQLLNTEVARAAVFRPVDVSSLVRDDDKPLQHLSYNLVMGTHFPISQTNDPVLPHRFCDLRPEGVALLFTTLNAAAHMNGLKGQRIVGSQQTVRVRTFVEVTRGNPAHDLSPGNSPAFRVHHLVHAIKKGVIGGGSSNNTNAAGSEKKKKDGADEEDADSDSEGSDMEVSGDDEEAIMRKERNAAARAKRKEAKLAAQVASGVAIPPAAATNAPKATDLGRCTSFTKGFEATVFETRQYGQARAELAEKKRTMIKELIDATPKPHKEFVEHQMGKLEAAVFSVGTTAQQYSKIVRPYLTSDIRMRKAHGGGGADSVIIDGNNVFVDPRTCVDFNTASVTDAGSGGSYQPYNHQIDPEVALSPITAMTHHTQGVDPAQCDIRRYYTLTGAQLDAILTLYEKKEGTVSGVGTSAGIPTGTSLQDFMEADEAVESLLHASLTEKHRKVDTLLTTSPFRIEYMQAAHIQPANFTGFPHPELVFEVPADLARPEILLRLPLPQPVLAPLNPMGAPLHAPAHGRFVNSLMRIAEVTRLNRVAQPARPQEEHEVTTRFRERVTTFFNDLMEAARALDATNDKRWIKPRGLYDWLREASLRCHSYGAQLFARSSIDRSFFYHTHMPELMKQTGGDIRFRELMERDYMLHVSGLSERELEQLEGASDGDGSMIMVTQRNSGERDDAANRVAALTARMAELTANPDADVAGNGEDEDGDSNSRYGDFLGNFPKEIIERDDALQLNRENSQAYAKLNYDAGHGEGHSGEHYRALLWMRVREATQRADDAFWNSDNIDSRTIVMREWYRSLTRKQRAVEFRVVPNVRPHAASRIWVNESMSSPVLNLAQNTTAMAIAFYASLTAQRFYEDNNNPKLNFLMAGDGASGKSFIMHALQKIMPPGILTTVTHMSNHAMHVRKNMDGFLYVYHEFQRRYLFPEGVDKKDGTASAAGGDAINFFKDRLTRGMISVVALEIDKKTKERNVLMFDASCQSTTIGGTNDDLANADENVLTRFIIFSVPKPRDIAEGSHPSDRTDVDEMDGKKMAAEHFGPRTRLYHQLLRFRYAYSEFMIKCGVLPNGMQTYGGRLVIDNVLNQMTEDFSIDTRDPRKRHMTTEMMRTMALFDACYLGLGSPLAILYRDGPTRPDIWSWESWLMCTVPFMYCGKDHAIDALTLLESIWSPQYLTRILFAIAFSMVNLHELNESCFHSIYRPAKTRTGGGLQDAVAALEGHEDEDGGSGGAGGEEERIIDYNYIVVRDRSATTRDGIYAKIADACGRFGIRAADVHQFLARLTRQYIPAHKLVRRNAMLAPVSAPQPDPRTQSPPPSASTGPVRPQLLSTDASLDNKIPHSFRALADGLRPGESDAGRALREALSSSASNPTPPLPRSAISRALADAEGELSMESLRVRQMDASMDAAGIPSASGTSPHASGSPDTSRPPVFEHTEAEAAVAAAATMGREFHASDAMRLEYDMSSDTVRIPIVKFEPIKRGNPRAGIQLCISTKYIEDRLKIQVSDPAGMRAARAKDKSQPRPAMESVPIDHMEAVRCRELEALGKPVPRGTSRWGPTCDADFVRRMKLAREMSDASLDVTSPILKCIETVLSNAWLEEPFPHDTEAREVLRLLKDSYAASYAKSTDPSKRFHYPWMTYVTSVPISDYVIESKNRRKFPDGRRVPFHDLLKVLHLKRNVQNQKMIFRDNYARLSVYARSIIDFEPIDQIRDKGISQVSEGGEFASSTYRYRIMNTNRGIALNADVDYVDAIERMNSVGHPGFDGMLFPRLIGWPPVTYYNLRMAHTALTEAGIIRRSEALHDNPNSIAKEFGIALEGSEADYVYPEDDPALELSYPETEIVKRIREFEIKDYNEAHGIMSHLTLASDLYGTGHVIGGVYFDTVEGVQKRQTERLAQKASGTTSDAMELQAQPPTEPALPPKTVHPNMAFLISQISKRTLNARGIMRQGATLAASKGSTNPPWVQKSKSKAGTSSAPSPQGLKRAPHDYPTEGASSTKRARTGMASSVQGLMEDLTDNRLRPEPSARGPSTPDILDFFDSMEVGGQGSAPAVSLSDFE